MISCLLVSYTGLARTKGSGSDQYTSSYLETYVSVGNPERIYDWILRTASVVTAIDVKEKSLGRKDGKVWISAKISADAGKQPITKVFVFNPAVL